MSRHLSSPSPTKLFLVDDEPVVRKGLRLLFSHEPGLEVCGEAGTEHDALEGILARLPDLAIVDLSLKEGDGLSLIKHLHRLRPKLRVLVFSMHEQVHFAATAFAAGAHGYVLKEEGAEQVLQAIYQVMRGRRYLSARIASGAPQLVPSGPRSARQRGHEPDPSSGGTA
jgi:DNA-binding NarL/FixJ family response regulator